MRLRPARRRSPPAAVLAATLAVTLGLALAACAPTPIPTPSPSAVATAQASAAAVASPPSSPSAVPSASPNAELPVDDPAFLAGEGFTVAVGDAGSDWAVPAVLAVMPNGQQAVRVAFLPASCEADVKLDTDPTPDDAWEVDLEDNDAAGYTMTLRPSAQIAECSGGQGRTYLQVGYHPLTTDGVIHLVASSPAVDGGPTEIQVVPVFTSADASQPTLAAVGSVSQGALSGPDKPRPTKPTLLFSDTFVGTRLPDGSMPTAWAIKVTGCGGGSQEMMVVSVQVGSDAPVEIGKCAEGAASSGVLSWPIPADGTRIAVLIAGGSTRTLLRVTQFQWRGDRG